MNIQEQSSSDNSQKVQLKQKLKYMKNETHVEYPVASTVHTLAVWKQLEEGGILRQLLGREIAIQESNAAMQNFLRAIHSNLA